MKLFVLRGDLQSLSGHSAASRDYAALLPGIFDKIVGVDIHFHPARPFERFPYPVVSDAEAQQLAAQASSTLVVTYATPEHYLRYPGAVNVGLTVWETDRLPQPTDGPPPWVEAINCMDGLWVQSTHSKKLYEDSGVKVPVRVVPWPTCVDGTITSGIPHGEIYDLDRRPWLTDALLNCIRFDWHRYRRLTELMNRLGTRAAEHFLQRVRTRSETIPTPASRSFLCVAQDVPRKGLMLLLSEWMEFKRRPEGKPWTLILKTSPLNPATRPIDFVLRFWEQVQALKHQLRVPRAGIYLWPGKLSNPDFLRLLKHTFASVTPSMGEGFCGPAAMALALGKPLVTPQHTAFADYVPANYRYAFRTRPVILSFVDDPIRGIYNPASAWQVAEPYSIANALSRLVTEEAGRRQEEVRRAQALVDAFCGPRAVRAILADEARRMPQGSPRRILHAA